MKNIALIYSCAAPTEAARVHRLPATDGARRSASWCGTTARSAAPRVAPRTRPGARFLPGARDAACSQRRSVATNGGAGTRVPAFARRRERTRELPGRALLAPGRPRALDRRSAREGGARERHEEHRRPPGACGQPGLRAQRAGARRALSPSAAADAERGETSPRLRLAQRSSPSREAASRGARRVFASRPRQLRALVRRLATGGRQPASRGQGEPRGRTPSNMAVEGGMAAARIGGSERATRLCGGGQGVIPLQQRRALRNPATRGVEW